MQASNTGFMIGQEALPDYGNVLSLLLIPDTLNAKCPQDTSGEIVHHFFQGIFVRILKTVPCQHLSQPAISQEFRRRIRVFPHIIGDHKAVTSRFQVGDFRRMNTAISSQQRNTESKTVENIQADQPRVQHDLSERRVKRLVATMPGTDPAAPGSRHDEILYNLTLRSVADDQEFESGKTALQFIGSAKEERKTFFPGKTAKKNRQLRSRKPEFLQE